MDYHINPSSGVWDDNYYANTGRYLEGGGGGSSANDYMNNFINSMVEPIKKIKPYEVDNPFAWDKQLAQVTQDVTAEYSPYYTETLSDYVANVEKKVSRSKEDLTSTLEQLNAGKEYYTGVERRALDKSIRNVGEGYAGRGLFFSGMRPRDIQELQTESQAKVGDYMRQYEYGTSQAQKGQARTAEDLATASSQYTRDIEREKKYAIESGILTRKGEAINEYQLKKQQYNDSANYYA